MSAAVLEAPAAAPPAPASGPACLYCGGRELALLHAGVRDRLEYVPGERTWWRCRKCQSTVLVPLPRAEDLAGFYPPVYSFTPDLARKGPLARIAAWLEYHLFFRLQYRAEAKQVARYLGGSPRGKRLLDVGCGRGLRLVEFRRLGFDVAGLDVQPAVVKSLNEDLRIPSVCADANDLDQHFPPASFDVVTAYQLVEHVTDVAGLLQACHAVLKPGGVVAIAVPLVDSWQAALFGRRWVNVSEAPRHLSLPTQKGLAAALGLAGFTDVQALPDWLPNCAGVFAMSALPRSALTHAYTRVGLRSMARRAAGAALALAAVPFCYVENEIAGRISVGVLLGRKPGGAGC